MKLITILIAIFSITQPPTNWGQNGHRIVAQICFDHLSETAKMKVSTVLGDDYLAQVATWPDYIRSEKNWDFAKDWHFITIDPSKTVEQVVEETSKNDKIDNIVEAIELMSDILKNDSDARNKFQKLMDDNKVEPLNNSMEATAIAFLIHFIGDIHQPMHVGKNNDYGGNKIRVLFFSEESNLHSVWDSGIIEKEQLSYSEFAEFTHMHVSSIKASSEKDKIEKWAEESITAREDIYNTLYDSTDRTTGLPDLSYQYQHDFLPVVENRLGAAGYRAAAIINSIFK